MNKRFLKRAKIWIALLLSLSNLWVDQKMIYKTT
jgi:hypothetical protein